MYVEKIDVIYAKTRSGKVTTLYRSIPPWIPVEKGLPEDASISCLVTVEEDDIYGEPQSVIYPEFVGWDGETWNDASGKQIAFDVIAWMPLPEPYKGESEG